MLILDKFMVHLILVAFNDKVKPIAFYTAILEIKILNLKFL